VAGVDLFDVAIERDAIVAAFRTRIAPDTMIAWPGLAGTLAGVNDQLFLGEELERAVALHIDGIAEVAVRGRKHGDDDAGFMVVGRFIDLLANCKFGHRELLLESLTRVSAQIG
jgi:hypothetical protein